MTQQQYPSELLEKAVQEFAKLPGIGRKTALRLVLNLLRREEDDVLQFTEAIARMRQEVKYCHTCHNISDSEVCPICSDPRRDASTICVVENIQDVMAVENTQQFQGLYHVLGGVISPMDGVGPADLEIDSLVERVRQGGVKEVILALYDGGRHHQLLHLPQAGTLYGCEADHHCTRHQCGRRVGIYRRGHAGTINT